MHQGRVIALTVTRVLALVAAAVLPLPVPARQSAEQISVAAVRFYRAEVSLTQVKAFVQVPLSLMQASAGGLLSYRVSITLKDSTGLTLSNDAWPQQQIRADLQEPGAFTVNSLEFVLRPGKHRLEVEVEDSVSGRRTTAATDIWGFSDPPAASDLVLSPRMRQYNPDSVPSGTEWRSGQILVTSIADVRLNPTSSTGSRIFYLLEAYTATADSGTMQVSIKDSTGRMFVQTAPTRVQVGPGGGVLRGQLNLEGLPSGRYSLHVAVQLTGGQTERSAGFTMSDLQEQLQRQAALAAARRVTDDGYFGAMSEAELDRAAEPLDYLADRRDLRAYEGATVDAKRRFLVDFWRRRDDTTTARNEAREEFYGKIAYADSSFRERGARTTPGWKTDRGRIYAKYGSPDETLDRVRAGRSPSYLVWRYTRRRDTWFVFSDRSGLGSYKLLNSNDRTEAGLPDWREVLGPDALRDVGLFLGVDFFTGN